MLIASMERFYLPCGNDSNGINDLHENPRLMATINATNAKFSPVMNGTFSPTEYWELGENIQAGFLETDTQHIDNYNYIFTGRQNGSLYVLVDECSDITDDPGSGEWISLWLSKNFTHVFEFARTLPISNGSLGSNFDLLTSELQLNLNATLNGSYYNLTLGQICKASFITPHHKHISYILDFRMVKMNWIQRQILRLLTGSVQPPIQSYPTRFTNLTSL